MKINWGVIGTSPIVYRFLEGLHYSDTGIFYGLYGRTPANVEKLCQKYPPTVQYPTYLDVLEDEHIDAIYIALPNKLHYEFSKLALEAGKAVLCEKPAALNVHETIELKELALKHNVLFMEAMKSKFAPGFIEVKRLIETGVIGKLESIEVMFCESFSPEQTTYHFEPIEGGCLLDLGIYNASLIYSLFNQVPKVDYVDYTLYPNGVEVDVRANLSTDTTKVILEVSFVNTKPRQAIIKGTDGVITLDNFHRCESFTLLKDDHETTYYYPYRYTDFYEEIHHFESCLLQNRTQSDIVSFDDMIAHATIIELIKNYINTQENVDI